MPDLNQLLTSRQAQKLMGDKGALDRIQSAPETKKLMEMLNRQGGDSLESMAEAAARGQSEQLMGAIQKLLRDPESQKLLSGISQGLGL